MRRIVLFAAVLGTAAAGAPLSADKEFVAMGDSITAGSSWPVSCGPCPTVFDCGGGCAASSSGRENCGHARRLDDWIDGWLGAADHVVNEGLGGEKTAAAVSRISTVLDAQCGTPGDCNAVLLMHGTNDMYDMNNPVSPETATANLGFMIDEAKSRNIDTLLMTVIRRVWLPDNQKWKDYKDLTLALATTKSVQSINPWLPLCATTNCFDKKYYVNSSHCSGGMGENDIGHLDPGGYDVLTDLIKAAFPAAAPIAAVPTSPAGDITETMPDFVWPEVADARWYELEVDATTTWWEAAVHCLLGTCTANPGVALAKSAHSWRVRGRNLRGMGTWSVATGFDVWGVPATPVPSAPSGQFFDATPTSGPFDWEPYTWSVDAEATDYDLEVSDGGGTVVMESFDSSICGGSICQALPPAVGLPADSYTWTVQARNPAATGPVSSPMAFEIFDEVPGEPTPTGPTGDHFEPFAPLYEWLPVAGATEYDLEVRDAGANLDASATGLLASVVCSAGACSYQGLTLADPDDYTLKVLGRNALGAGNLSSIGADFTILVCLDPSEKDLAVLEPSPVTTVVVVPPHCGPVVAAELAPYSIETGGNLTVHTRDGFTAFDGFSVEGELTVRSP